MDRVKFTDRPTKDSERNLQVKSVRCYDNGQQRYDLDLLDEGLNTLFANGEGKELVALIPIGNIGVTVVYIHSRLHPR